MKARLRIIIVAMCAVLFTGTLTIPGIATDILGHSSEGTEYTRDFQFGLGSLKQAIGNTVYDRFLNKKQELPDEIPVFKPYEIKGKTEFYVSNDGSNKNPGTIEKPFQTLQYALKQLQRVGDRSGGVVIFLREGIYNMTEGVVIPEYASGTPDAPLIISSYQDEDVHLVGGISISGKHLKLADDAVANRKLPYVAKGKVYSVNLSSLGIDDCGTITKSAGPPKCFVDGVEFNLARFPNAETLPMRKYEGADGENGVVETGPILDKGSELGAYTGDTGEGFEFAISNNRPFTWENTGDIWMYGSFYEEWNKHYARVKYFDNQKKSVRSSDYTQYGARYSATNSHYYFNVLEELDSPGEWFFDRNTGIFYLYPISDETADMNITITTTQSDIVTFDNCNHVVLNGITVEAGGNDGISMKGKYNLVQNCVIQDLVNYGIKIAANNSGMITSIVRRTGNYSAYVLPRNSGRGINDLSFLNPTRNFIQNCYLYNGLRGIYNDNGVQNIYTHNCVMNSKAMSINMGSGNDMLVEYNEVVGGPYVNSDSGQLYINGNGTSKGDHIRYNYFHDSRADGSDKKPLAIYFDDRASGHYAYGNILQGGGFFSHGGSDNVVENNILVDIYEKQLSLSNSMNYYNGYEDRWSGWVVKSGSAWHGVTNHSNAENDIWRTRYPEFYTWTGLLLEHQKNYESDNHQRDDLENYLRQPRYTVFKNNILFNTADYVKQSIEHEVVYEGNKLYETNPGFVDYENKNYDLKSDSAVFTEHKDFYPLPKQSKMGVVEELFGEKPVMNDIKPISPPIGENERVVNNGVVLNWTQAFGATYYEVEVAKDAEFSDVIAKVKTAYNAYTLRELDFGQTYYWRVTAHTLAEGMNRTPVVMPTASFTVYTVDEAVKYIQPDTFVFENVLKKAELICESILEEDGNDYGVGVYKKGTKDAIQRLIKDGHKTLETEKLQSVLDEKQQKFEQEFISVLTDMAIPYTRNLTEFKADEWINSNPAKSNVIFDSEGKNMSVSSDSNFIMFHNKMLSPKEKVAFSVYYDTLDNWTALNIKQMESGVNSPTQTEGYYIVVKPDVIELQRKPIAKGEENSILLTVENNNTIISANKWYDITTLAENTPDGVHIEVTVNGEPVIDYVDSNGPVKGLGYFAFMHNTANKGMKISPSSGEYSDDVIRTAILEESIAKVRQFADEITISEIPMDIPTYIPGTKEMAIAAANEAEIAMKEAVSQNDITGIKQQLDKAVFEIKKNNANPAMTHPDMGASMWTPFKADGVLLENMGDILQFTPSSSMCVMYGKNLAAKESIAFSMQLEKLADWTAISVRQTSAAERPTRTKGYFFVIKSDLIELQKYTASAKGEIVLAVENNGKYISAGKWADVKTGAVNTAEGVLLNLTIDGQNVIEYLDTDNPIYDEGTAAFFCNVANGKIQLK